jgi:hypothetical protein
LNRLREEMSGHRRVDVRHVGQGKHAHGVEQPQLSRLGELAHDPPPLDLVELEPPRGQVGLVLAAEPAVQLSVRLGLVDGEGVGPAGERRRRGGQEYRARADRERCRVAEGGPVDERYLRNCDMSPNLSRSVMATLRLDAASPGIRWPGPRHGH